jgi:glycosyltransferase involved in cell wall biosynthesis/SAM-dependent methyltransferase
MLLHKSVVHDSRVRREARALVEDRHAVTVLELAPVEDERLDGFARRSVLPAPWVRRALPFQLYRLVFAARFVRALAAERPDVIHAHDAAMLLPGLLGRRLTGALLVYDSHELATGVPYRDRRWAAFVRAIERLALPRCAAVITVSDGIAEALRGRYALPATPAVVRNVADVRAEPPPPAEGEAIVLHQGSAADGRGADVLVRAMAGVPEARLVLLGASEAERGPLLRLARECGVEGRVEALPALPVEELLAFTARAAVGVTLLQDTCENHRLALPNKAFEYLAAGVPVLAADLPELRRLVRGEGIGWTVDPASPDAVAEGLRRALAGRADPALRERLAGARRRLRWDVERERLLDVYRGLGSPLARTYDAYAADPGKRRAWDAANPGNAAIRQELLERLLEGAAGAEGLSILDVGCGSGWLLRELAARGAEVVGVDALPDRVERARAAVPAARVEHADAAALPFADGAFDVVTLVTVLSSIPERERRVAVLRECARVVAPGGAVLVYDTRRGNPRNRATSRFDPAELAEAGLAVRSDAPLTVLPPLARRLGLAAPRLYPVLARVRPLLTHGLTVAAAP